jgi:hypothetical protein
MFKQPQPNLQPCLKQPQREALKQRLGLCSEEVCCLNFLGEERDSFTAQESTWQRSISDHQLGKALFSPSNNIVL